MKKLLILPLFSFMNAYAAQVKPGAFVDSYYAYDFNRPIERKFTTQPVRHNELNINMAYLDATLTSENYRGRLALQGGDSVRKNTESEPGGETLEYIQEAYLGHKFGETWIDAGIFLGHIGAESWISKDNYTYSRSLNLDYVPYYSAGVRLHYESFQFQILNGWSNISENNSAKAIGMQYKRSHFTYNNFFGDEEVVSTSPRFRGYHNFIYHMADDKVWQFIGAFDVGHQSQQNNNGIDIWYATSLTARRVLDEKNAFAMRAEYYNDSHQANVITGSLNGFKVISTSVNFDHKILDNALWRNEVRGFYSADKIYPEGKNKLNHMDGFFVTSLSAWY